MRLFVGFLIPEEFKSSIVALQSEIEQLGADCKNVESENLHISMSFLGETATEDTEKIKEDMNLIASQFKEFYVDIKGTLAIPSKNFVRVVALDIFDESDVLEKLTNEIRQKIGGDVKPPHLTLCRVKSTRNKDSIIGFVAKYENKSFVSIKISSIQLIESKLERDGPKYSAVAESFLRK